MGAILRCNNAAEYLVKYVSRARCVTCCRSDVVESGVLSAFKRGISPAIGVRTTQSLLKLSGSSEKWGGVKRGGRSRYLLRKCYQENSRVRCTILAIIKHTPMELQGLRGTLWLNNRASEQRSGEYRFLAVIAVF